MPTTQKTTPQKPGSAKKPSTKRKKRQPAVMGRPIKLTEARLKKTLAYLKAKRTERECPFVEELAVYELDINRHTVTDWATKGTNEEYLQKQQPAVAKLYRDFSATIKKLADMQLMYLKVKGIGDKNNSVAIFLMKADHGMIETQRHEVGGIGGKPIEYAPIQVLTTKRPASEGQQ